MDMFGPHVTFILQEDRRPQRDADRDTVRVRRTFMEYECQTVYFYLALLKNINKIMYTHKNKSTKIEQAFFTYQRASGSCRAMLS